MATHTDVSKLNKTFQSHFAHKELVWLLGLILALSLVFIGVNNLTLAPKADAFSVDNRALQAWAARYKGLAAVHAVQADASSQRAVAAASARYQALADHYTLRNAPASQQALQVWSARYQGLADDYALKNMSPAQGALQAWSSRYQELAEFYASEK